MTYRAISTWKLLLFLLILCAAAGLMMGTGTAETINGVCDDGVPWQYDTVAKLLIVGSTEMEAPVQTMANYASSEDTPWYPYMEQIKEIHIHTVRNVGNNAFANLPAVQELHIGYQVLSIGESAFAGCTRLRLVEMGSGGYLRTIGKGAFQGCTALATVRFASHATMTGIFELSDYVTTIGENAFQGCVLITSINIPASADVIENGAFSGCSALTSVTIATRIKTLNIGENVFQNTALKTVAPTNLQYQAAGSTEFRTLTADALLAGNISIKQSAYSLWVGGTQVTDANMADIPMSNGTGTGKASYDPLTNTLTLNNYTYTGAGDPADSYGNAIECSNMGDLTIVLHGDNRFTYTGTKYVHSGFIIYGSDVTITGDGSLSCVCNLLDDGRKDRYGLWIDESTVKLYGGELIVIGRSAAIRNDGSITGYTVGLAWDNTDGTGDPVQLGPDDSFGSYKKVQLFGAPVPVTGLELETDLTLLLGEAQALTPVFEPDYATDTTLTWTSSDEGVATVADGVVTGIATGQAVITATATNGTEETDDDVYAVCAVTVTTDWELLQGLIDATPEGGTVTLTQEYEAVQSDVPLRITSGQTVTINLAGCELNRGLTEAQTDGQVIINNGNLTITDSVGGGVITRGYGASGSDGGAIVNNGKLTLAGGTITGNQAVNSGGAVLNKAGATFTMTGGTITGNTCGAGGGGAVVNYGTMNLSGGAITGNVSGQNGGGIWNKGTLNISGGSITGNTANDKGAGIYARGESTLTLSGSLVITDNSSTQHGASNLFINMDNYQLPAITVNVLAEGSRIGVSCSVAPIEDEYVVLMRNVSGYMGYFVSDLDSYLLSEDRWGRLVLNVRPAYRAPDFTLPADITAIEESAFECADMSAVYIHDGCGSIGDHAFKDCLSLTQIRIPADCDLGEGVFDGCELVYVYSTAGSPVEAYCVAHDNCVFVPAE